MLKEIIKIANKLDGLGLTKEADLLDRLIVKMSGMSDLPMDEEDEEELEKEEEFEEEEEEEEDPFLRSEDQEPSYFPGKKSPKEKEYKLPYLPRKMRWPSDIEEEPSPEQVSFEESMIPMGARDVGEKEDFEYYGEDTLKSILKRLEYLEEKIMEEKEEKERGAVKLD